MLLNGRVVVDVEVDGVDTRDYPDFCDAYFSYAVFEDTLEELTDEELELLTENNSDVLNEMAYERYL
jgi:hypothetical protein